MKSATRLQLTERALLDIAEIQRYTTAHWGSGQAERYKSDLSAGLTRIRENPELLSPIPGIGSELQSYRINSHLLVCDIHENSIVVITVIHASMDIPARLAEIQPTMVTEVKLLHRSARDK